MNRLLPVVSLVLAASAVVIAFVSKESPASPSAVAPALAPAGRDLDDRLDVLERKVDGIEDEQRSMWNRVLVLERRAQGLADVTVDGGLPGLQVQAPALVAEVAQLKQELRSVMQGEVMSDSAGRAAMKDLVREAEGDLARERQARRQERQQQRAAEQQAKWKRFITDARLTSQQEQTLTQRLAAEDASRKALFERGTPPERDELRALRDQRRETDSIMLPLLDEQQLQQYRELRQDDQGGGSRDRGTQGGNQRTPGTGDRRAPAQ